MKTDLDPELVLLIRDAVAQERQPSALHRNRLKRAILETANEGDRLEVRTPRISPLLTRRQANGARHLVRQAAVLAAWGAGLGLAFAGVIEGRAIMNSRTSSPSVQTSKPLGPPIAGSSPAHRRPSPQAEPPEPALEQERPETRSIEANPGQMGPQADPAPIQNVASPSPVGPLASHGEDTPASSSGGQIRSLAREAHAQPVPQTAVAQPIAGASASAGETNSSNGEQPRKTDTELRAELDLMSQVQAALRDRRAGQALELIERHDAVFGQGQLNQERLAAEVFAACQLRDRARARSAAARFLASDTSSPLALRVRGACR
jgi:hypothetical protein